MHSASLPSAAKAPQLRHTLTQVPPLPPAAAARRAGSRCRHSKKERKIYARLQACVKGALSQCGPPVSRCRHSNPDAALRRPGVNARRNPLAAPLRSEVRPCPRWCLACKRALDARLATRIGLSFFRSASRARRCRLARAVTAHEPFMRSLCRECRDAERPGSRLAAGQRTLPHGFYAMMHVALLDSRVQRVTLHRMEAPVGPTV
jgi:hypothetical protein